MPFQFIDAAQARSMLDAASAPAKPSAGKSPAEFVCRSWPFAFDTRVNDQRTVVVTLLYAEVCVRMMWTPTLQARAMLSASNTRTSASEPGGTGAKLAQSRDSEVRAGRLWN